MQRLARRRGSPHYLRMSLPSDAVVCPPSAPETVNGGTKNVLPDRGGNRGEFRAIRGLRGAWLPLANPHSDWIGPGAAGRPYNSGTEELRLASP